MINPAPHEVLQPVDKYYIAARVLTALEATFAHWEDVGDLNNDALFRALLADIAATTSRQSFSLVMARYLAAFRNAHTEFIDLSLLPVTVGAFPIRLRDCAGRWFVIRSELDTLATGEEITHINGETAGDFLAAYLPYVAASRDAYRGYGLFLKMVGLPQTLNLTTRTGVRLDVHRQALRARLPAVTGTEFEDHAVIRIPSFEEPAFEEDAIALVRQFAGKRYLIIDVRGNGGGQTPSGLVEALMDRPYPGWVETSASRTGLEVAETFPRHGGRLCVGQTPRTMVSWSTGWKQPGEDAFGGGLAILIDLGCKSATEDFLMPFAATGRATLVGETTAGSSGQPYVEEPFPGMLFTIGAKRQLFPDLQVFEGRGIAPDIPVDAMAALHAGSDLHLETARKAMG